MLSVTSFVLMGTVATREAFDWMSKDPLIVKASSVICRLSDDIVGHEVRYTNYGYKSMLHVIMGSLTA